MTPPAADTGACFQRTPSSATPCAYAIDNDIPLPQDEEDRQSSGTPIVLD